jgi:hypothetical protein
MQANCVAGGALLEFWRAYDHVGNLKEGRT